MLIHNHMSELSVCFARTLIYAYIERQWTRARVYLKDTALRIVPQQRDLVICGHVGVEPDGKRFLLFFHQAGREVIMNPGRWSFSAGCADCLNATLLMLKLFNVCTIFTFCWEPKNPKQHITSCLNVSCCHTALHLWTNLHRPPGRRLGHMTAAFPPRHLNMIPSKWSKIGLS